MGIVPYSGTDLAMFYTLKARWMAANPEAKVKRDSQNRRGDLLCLSFWCDFFSSYGTSSYPSSENDVAEEKSESS